MTTGDCSFTTDIVLDKDGYPRVKHNRRLWRLNRLMYTWVHGEIPEGKIIGHSCNNPSCINPNHLYLTTPAENSSHASRDGLYFTGHHNENIAKAEDDWERLHFLYNVQGLSQESIGTIYGIHQSRVSELLRQTKEKYLAKQGIERIEDDR